MNINADHWYFVHLFLQDMPSFTQSVHRFVNDLRYYRLINSSLPSGSVKFWSHIVQGMDDRLKLLLGQQGRPMWLNVACLALRQWGFGPLPATRVGGGSRGENAEVGGGGCIHLADQEHWSALPNDYSTIASTHLLLLILFLPSASGFPLKSGELGLEGCRRRVSFHPLSSMELMLLLLLLLLTNTFSITCKLGSLFNRNEIFGKELWLFSSISFFSFLIFHLSIVCFIF